MIREEGDPEYEVQPQRAAADLLLSWVTGGPLEPWVNGDIEALRAERLAAVRRRT